MHTEPINDDDDVRFRTFCQIIGFEGGMRNLDNNIIFVIQICSNAGLFEEHIE